MTPSSGQGFDIEALRAAAERKERASSDWHDLLECGLENVQGWADAHRILRESASAFDRASEALTRAVLAGEVVVVPREPTEAMIEAAGGEEFDPSRWDDPTIRPADIYAAMLSALPAPPSNKGTDNG